MRKIISFYKIIVEKFNNLQSLPLLLLRLILAYGFFMPATMKWKNIQSISEWFTNLGIPAPTFTAHLVATTETIGAILLILGLGTRLISVPLIITLLVAIVTVHWSNGFEASENGFEIPLYYILMLLTLVIFGSGKISLDYLISKKINQNSSIKI
jgi:putative oxidoreductase